MAITAAVNMQASITVEPDGVFVGDDGSYVVNGMNFSTTLTASTTPPVTKFAAWQKALSSGTGTIDLTALPDEDGAGTGVTFSGLKVQVARFHNPSSNANSITVAEGGSNGYELLGNGWTVTIPPGGKVDVYLPDNGPDVGGSAKDIALTGTGAQALNVTLVAG